MNVIDQVMMIFAGTKGYLDKVPVKEVSPWQDQFLRFMRTDRADVRNALVKTKKFNPDLEKQLGEAITAFQSHYTPPAGAQGGGEDGGAQAGGADHGSQGDGASLTDGPTAVGRLAAVRRTARFSEPRLNDHPHTKP